MNMRNKQGVPKVPYLTRNELSGDNTIQSIAQQVHATRHPHEMAAAIIQIAKLSVARDRTQRARVRRLGTAYTVRVRPSEAEFAESLEEVLNEILQEAEDPRFVLEELLLSATDLELVSNQRYGVSAQRTFTFRVCIMPRSWEQRVRVCASGQDHFDLNSQVARRRAAPSSALSGRRPQKAVAVDASKRKRSTRSRNDTARKRTGRQRGKGKA